MAARHGLLLKEPQLRALRNDIEAGSESGIAMSKPESRISGDRQLRLRNGRPTRRAALRCSSTER